MLYWCLPRRPSASAIIKLRHYPNVGSGSDSDKLTARICFRFAPESLHRALQSAADLHKPPEGVRVDLLMAVTSRALCGSVADQRDKHEIKGCRHFDPAPVGRLARRAAGISVCGVS
jgi:hypothetical protein